MNNTVLHIISGDLWGGAEVQMCHQIVAMNQLGPFRCQVLMFSEGMVAERYREAGIEVTVIPEALGVIGLVKGIRQKLKQTSPLLLVTHGYKETITGYSALFWSKLRSTSLLITYHGSTENYRGLAGLKMQAYLFLQNLIARCIARKLITCSESLAKQLRLPSEKVLVNYNVSPLQESAVDCLPSTPAFGTRPAVVIVGRLVPVKRVDRAIRVIGLARGIQLYIVGSGPEEGALKDLVKELRLEDQVHFLGFRNDSAQLIASADALLISSDSEGVPTVLLEALSCGTPVVSTSLPGVLEVMQHFENYPFSHFPPDDIEQGAKSLEEVFQQQRAKKFSKIYRCLFTPEAAASRLSRLYKSLVP